MRISDWSSDVCSSDLYENLNHFLHDPRDFAPGTKMTFRGFSKPEDVANVVAYLRTLSGNPAPLPEVTEAPAPAGDAEGPPAESRSEEHTSELQSLMRKSYAVFCLKKKILRPRKHKPHTPHKSSITVHQ